MTTLTTVPRNTAVEPADIPTRASWTPQILAAVRALALLTLLLGGAYPLVVTGVAQLAFHNSANGSLVQQGGQVVGSRLLGQSFGDPTGRPLPQWFQPRPSAAGHGYDAASSSASNLGPENADLLTAVEDRRAAVATADGVDPADVPPDALTASASGLDPDISPTYARQQVDRVAKARGLDPAAVRRLVDRRIRGRQLGFLGEQHVNVLELNLALASLSQRGGGRRNRMTDATGTITHVARGQLRIYLGAAPGVGKTYEMLGEAHRRMERGCRVAVGFVATHERVHTAAMLEGLPIIPTRTVTYRGATFQEMDADAILARRPELVLVDELAHTNVPGSPHEKRWQDVEDILAAGIDVLSTVNIQHLESLNDVVAKITGVPQRETVPDKVVRRADQVQLVDSTPEALRRRMAHGNIYPPERVDAALSNYFRPSNLTALRELALLWLADKVDDGLQQLRADLGVTETWETRERILVALTGGAEGETLLRRAARIADRARGGELLAVYVARSDGLTTGSPAALARQRLLVETLGGSYHVLVGDDVAAALLQFARAENVTQLVLGASRRSWLSQMLGRTSIGAEVLRESGDIDVHMVTHERAGGSWRLPRPTTGVTRRRRLWGLALSVVLPVALTAALTQMRGTLNLTSDALLYLFGIVMVALVGGAVPAAVTALVAAALLNWYFTPPLHTFTIAEHNNVLAVLVFLLVGGAVSAVVDLAARRTSQAARATAEAATLFAVAGSVLRGESALPALLDRLRVTFAMASVALLERDSPQLAWSLVASSGSDPATSLDDGDVSVPVGDRLALVLRGRPLPGEDRRVLGAFAAQAAVALERKRLSEAAEAAETVREADRVRTALLAAVGHDLRTPLAAAKAAIATLRAPDLQLGADDRAELLDAAEQSLDRLTRVLLNLLDMSRLQAGAISVVPQVLALDEVVPLALDSLGETAAAVTCDIPADLPPVRADAGLLERVVANLVANALRYTGPDRPPHLTGSALGDRVELRVIDRGHGVAAADRDRIFVAFQRLGDTDNTTGVGLGLALSRGLAEAMGGTLAAEDTPGGGLTMVLALSAATERVE